jgi:hypothetical protein
MTEQKMLSLTLLCAEQHLVSNAQYDSQVTILQFIKLAYVTLDHTVIRDKQAKNKYSMPT